MKTEARVREVRHGRAFLSCELSRAACSACGGGHGCALRWITPSAGALEVPSQSAGGRSLAPGDAVQVEVAEGELLRAAALAYLPPLVGLLLGPLAARVAAPGSEPTALALALVGLAAGWGLSRAWLRRRPPDCRVTLRQAP